VSCERWRDAVSARADGEEIGMDPALLDAHLATCPGCRAFERDVAVIRRPFRLQVSPPMPDLSRQVVKRSSLLTRIGRWSMVRGLLAIVAVEIIVMAVPSLVLGEDQGAAAHTARHLGAFSVAYAVGLLVVVARPARARTLLPVAGVLAAALVISAVADVVDGVIPLLGESGHLPELLSVPLLWLLAVPVQGRRGRARGETAWSRSLHLVTGEARPGDEEAV
jgi:predicted anti-sigma-YlaC factor YlaD